MNITAEILLGIFAIVIFYWFLPFVPATILTAVIVRRWDRRDPNYSSRRHNDIERSRTIPHL